MLRLYGDNAKEFSLSELIVPLAVAVGLTALALALLALVWRESRRAAVVTSALVVPFLTFGLITSAVGLAWPDEPLFRSYFLTLAIWIAVLGLAAYGAARLRGRLGAVTEALNLIALVLVIVAMIPIVTHEMAGATRGETSSASDPASDRGVAGQEEPLRDIYHLVLDRYGSDDALSVGLGIDNTEYTQSLRDRGFHVVEGSHANFERTVLSLASTFDMSLLDDVALEMGPDNPSWDPLFDLVASSPVGSTLQDLGYRYVHVGSWFRQTAGSETADLVVRPVHRIDLRSVLVDQSAITGLAALADIVLSAAPRGSDERLAETTLTQIERVHDVVEQTGEPKYVFVHLLLPHEPYVLLGDGTIAPDEASFATQLEFANAALDDLVSKLLDRPSEDQPIIIIQADEGPYPEGYDPEYTDFDWENAPDEALVTKFGVLNAMYLPGEEGAEPPPDGMTLVNTYPEILSRYFGLDFERQEDRVYVSTDGRPYDRQDITDDLAAAEERLGLGGSQAPTSPPDS